jgi:hypothetical protein
MGRGLILMYNLGIRLEGLREPAKNLKSGQPVSRPRFELNNNIVSIKTTLSPRPAKSWDSADAPKLEPAV